MIMKSTLY